jgi:hypothetical protein
MNARITFSSLALATTLATGCTTTPELTGQLNSVASSAPQHGMNGAAPHVTPEDWIDQGALITLYAADTTTAAMDFHMGNPGSIIQDHEVRNRNSHMAFGVYGANAFVIGIQGGDKGYLVDLGSSTELAERYQYAETVGNNQGFASIRFVDGELVIRSDNHDNKLQPLGINEALASQDRNAKQAPVVYGHVYVARVQRDENPAKDLYAKFKVVEFIPDQSVTIRWMPLLLFDPYNTNQRPTPR